MHPVLCIGHSHTYDEPIGACGYLGRRLKALAILFRESNARLEIALNARNRLCSRAETDHQAILSISLSSIIIIAYDFTKRHSDSLNELSSTFLLRRLLQRPLRHQLRRRLCGYAPVLPELCPQPIPAPTSSRSPSPPSIVETIEEVEQRIYKPTAQYQADEKEAWSFIKKDAHKPVAVG